MRAEDTPFPPIWIGHALRDAGLDAVRPEQGTYGGYDPAGLPPLPMALDGSYGWLEGEAEQAEWAIGNAEAEAAIARLLAAEPGLPAAFASFLRRGELHRRIRSYTACFLDVCPGAVAAPGGEGRLVRFLADQQGGCWWYVFLPPEARTSEGDHAVLVSCSFYGAPGEWVDDEPAAPLSYVAPDIESFLARTWIENEIAFAEDEAAMPAAARLYLERYRAMAARA